MYKLDVVKVDPDNNTHKLIIEEMIRNNSKWFLDDSITTVDQFVSEHLEGIKDYGFVGFIAYIDEIPYGYLFAEFDRYKNAYLTIVNNPIATKWMHFYTSQKVFKQFIDYLFNTEKANKLICYMFTWNERAEKACRYIGFRKEGIAKGQIVLNGKSINQLYLGLTKEDYIRSKQDGQRH